MSELPGQHTLLAAIVRNTPAEGTANVSVLCRSEGHKPRSLRAAIGIAITGKYIEPVRPAYASPQASRLTPKGVLATSQLEG